MFLSFKKNTITCLLLPWSFRLQMFLLLGELEKQFMSLGKDHRFLMAFTSTKPGKGKGMPLTATEASKRRLQTPSISSVCKGILRSDNQRTSQEKLLQFLLACALNSKLPFHGLLPFRRELGELDLFISIIKEILSHWNIMPFSVTDSHDDWMLAMVHIEEKAGESSAVFLLPFLSQRCLKLTLIW